MIQSDYRGPVWVAQDNLCSHIDEFIHEKEPALKHLLVNQHTALRLGGRDQDHTQKIGG